MTNAAAMTYDSLSSDIEAYADVHDSEFTDQIPRFIMLAENDLTLKVKGLGLLRAVTGNFIATNPTYTKPERWRETVSLSFYPIGGGDIVFIYERSYEYVRRYWPNPTKTAAPKYIANYDYTHFIVGPTPDQAYPFELMYHERPVPLSSSVQTNWTTDTVPQLILSAALLKAQPFIKRDDRIAVFQAMYSDAVNDVAAEAKRQLADRSTLAVENS